MESRVENMAIRSIVDDVLAEDESHKAKRKREKDPDGKPKKSVRFKDVNDVHEFEVDEPDHEEDGPIKEHLLGQAWQKRQLTRDGKAFNPNDINFNLGNEDAPEEEAQYDHLDGEEVSAFNMKDEEAEGFNTLTGEIAPRKNEDEEVAKDPWLLSLQQEEREETQGDDGMMRAKVRRSQITVDDETRLRLEKEQEALDNVKPLTEEELAEARSTLVQHMQPRETVMQAMARLSAKPSKNAPQKAAERVGKKRLTPEDQARLDLIERFTDAASSLLSTEADIFDQHKEELEHSLRMSSILRDPAAPSGSTAAASGGESDDDMFADSDGEDAAGAQKQAAGAASGAEGASGAQEEQPQPVTTVPSTDNPSASSRQGQDVGDVAGSLEQDAGVGVASTGQGQDYSQWPVSELRRVLVEAKVDLSGCTEKSDLVKHMQELDRSRTSTATPVGFVLDPVSGYYFNAETGWYFHAQSGCYYRNGRWYQMDMVTGAYKEIQG